MSPETAFQIANGLAPLAWIGLMAAPRSKVVQRAVLNGAFIAALSVAYAAVVFTHFDLSGADFSSLEGVMALLNDPWAMTAGWIHYLAFDLLAGVMVTRKALEMDMPLVMRIPCQLGCFMLGPVGVVMFIALAKARGARWNEIALG